MGHILVTTRIRAPIERCFDLARDVDTHVRTSSFTSERVLPPGRTSGLLELGDDIVFDGRHFGLRWPMTARIVEMTPPVRFVDECIRGAFQSLRHLHQFSHRDGVTEMVDELEWRPSFGLIGAIVDCVALERHMRWYVTKKQLALKPLAESEGGARPAATAGAIL
jgi:ligand-binding SRPBCC domain-containing protein